LLLMPAFKIEKTENYFDIWRPCIKIRSSCSSSRLYDYETKHE
jgi:hypothetical protein